jgi:hypothetical protein
VTTFTQQVLLPDPEPPSLIERGIDLRRCDVVEMMASLPDKSADLVIADPPWSYVQKHGMSRADNHYLCLPMSKIVEHLNLASRIAPRMACWVTGPLAASLARAELNWGPYITQGSWHKHGDGTDSWYADADSGHYGQGYHWAGCVEYVYVYVRGKSYINRSQKLRNGWTEAPGEHSRKPVDWQVQWIRKWTKPGARIVSLYSGLGSTEEAVLRAGGGRACVGAELDPVRHKQACGLLAQVRA